MASAHAARISAGGVRVLEQAHLDWWKHFWLKSFLLVAHDLKPKLEFPSWPWFSAETHRG
jgi:hypothetical protein